MEYNTASVCISSPCCIETYRLHLPEEEEKEDEGEEGDGGEAGGGGGGGEEEEEEEEETKKRDYKNACGVLLIAFIVRESNNYKVIQSNKYNRRLQVSTPNAASSDCKDRLVQ